jgi:hypothetical protein
MKSEKGQEKSERAETALADLPQQPVRPDRGAGPLAGRAVGAAVAP